MEYLSEHAAFVSLYDLLFESTKYVLSSFETSIPLLGPLRRISKVYLELSPVDKAAEE
jgi:hypothetical protein